MKTDTIQLNISLSPEMRKLIKDAQDMNGVNDATTLMHYACAVGLVLLADPLSSTRNAREYIDGIINPDTPSIH